MINKVFTACFTLFIVCISIQSLVQSITWCDNSKVLFSTDFEQIVTFRFWGAGGRSKMITTFHFVAMLNFVVGPLPPSPCHEFTA